MDRRIGDYALLGGGSTAALVGRDGSVDWLCLPRFDSGAVFAAILGDDSNGRWKIAPADSAASGTRAYRPNTLILETTWTTESGRASVVDFMTPGNGAPELIRIVEGHEGSVDFELDLTIRLDYGRTVPWVRRGADGLITAVSGPDMLILRSSGEIENADMHSRASFTVSEGQRQIFCLSHQASWLNAPEAIDPLQALAATREYWEDFARRCPEVGFWTENVRRSLITLKALVYETTGGIVAAPTTSLPERIGGSRNWDYRYCWLRDSALTLMAFLEVGYLEEAVAWRDWLLRAIAGDPAQMRIMYGLAGERTLTEWTADWLPGFRNSTPVRIGNAASEQFQLDVYGEVVEMLTLAQRSGMQPHPEARRLAATFLPWLERVWCEPDDGIWEMRSDRQHFVHSKIMAWVAFDRAARFALDNGDDDGMAAHWQSVAATIHAEVCDKGFDAGQNTFVQFYGSRAVDASLLHVVLAGFLPPDDARVIGTVEAVERRLLRDGFVARYDSESSDDGISDDREGAFLICTFWLVDALVLIGRQDDAIALFERACGACNDLGLLAEEYDPATGEQLGNFPQAFSHVGLILSALNLSRVRGPAGKRADHAAAGPET